MIQRGASYSLILTSVAAAAVLLAATAVWSPSAKAATCGSAVAYPGNDATSTDYANWMANSALLAKLPPELPVMAALVESGLRNLSYGDADSVGFFQMRKSIWNTGKYKGYLKKPDLQMQWFTDQAASVRASYISKGKGDPALNTKKYGVWIADVERPAERYRGRYQPRLAQAQQLISRTCPDLIGVNVLAPESSLRIKKRQHPGRSGQITVRVSCPKDDCVASVGALFRLPGRRGLIRLESDTHMLTAGSKSYVRVAVPRAVRKSIRQRLARGGSTRARLRITVGGNDGASTVRVRKIKLAR